MRKVKLGTITDSCLGKMLDAEKNRGTYQPYLANINVRWGDFELDNLPQMRFEDDEQERYGIVKGDLIVCEGGEPGRCAIWDGSIPNMKIQKALHRVRAHQGIDIRYIYYWMLLAGKKNLLKNYFTGSTIKHLPGDKLKEILIDVPNYKTQTQVADILASIDSLIKHNQKINDNLQHQLKLMYDYWFTQFDFPDENGKPYRSSGGAMVWNEQLKRNIPAGWAADNLYAVADYINGLACQNYRPDNDEHKLPVIKITEMHNGITDSTEFVRDDIPEKYIIENGDILFSWSATLETMLWYGGRGGLNQHIFKVVPKAPKYFAYSQLSSYIINFKAIAEARKTTMGHITTDHMEQSRIAIPPTIVQETFNRQVTPLYEEYANNCKENLRLQALRDWLLPMLMNGQATIAD